MHLGELLRDDGIDRDLELEDRVETAMMVNRILDAANKGGLRPPWAALAACRGQTDIMFPERGASTAPAKALCAACPVAPECREWGDVMEQGVGLYGILAGESAEKRKLRRRAERRAAAA
ncbi:MAG: WhiB family transcriptional regulator [Microthrixaceae bacterium]